MRVKKKKLQHKSEEKVIKAENISLNTLEGSQSFCAKNCSKAKT